MSTMKFVISFIIVAHILQNGQNYCNYVYFFEVFWVFRGVLVDFEDFLGDFDVDLAGDLEKREDFGLFSSIFWAISRVIDFGSVSLSILALFQRPGPFM